MTTSRSASSQIIAADFPPSSRLERVKFRAQLVAIARPAAVEPVKVTISTSGWPTRRAPASPPPGSTLTTRSEEHTSELQSLMRISYAVFRLKKKTKEYAK